MKYLKAATVLLFLFSNSSTFAETSLGVTIQVEASSDDGSKKKRRHKRIGKKRKRKCKKFAKRGFAG